MAAVQSPGLDQIQSGIQHNPSGPEGGGSRFRRSQQASPTTGSSPLLANEHSGQFNNVVAQYAHTGASGRLAAVPTEKK